MQDGQELAAALVSRCPAKIDLGPVYNVDPARRHAYAGAAPLSLSHRAGTSLESSLLWLGAARCARGGGSVGPIWHAA
jgi:hypothetical protein